MFKLGCGFVTVREIIDLLNTNPKAYLDVMRNLPATRIATKWNETTELWERTDAIKNRRLMTITRHQMRSRRIIFLVSETQRAYDWMRDEWGKNFDFNSLEEAQTFADTELRRRGYLFEEEL